MSEQNIFEIAAKNKYRFPSRSGELTVEDLYDLSIPSLEDIAAKINVSLQAETKQSFFTTVKKTNTGNDIKLAIVLHIGNAKIAELEAAKDAAARRAKIAQLKELAATKANEQLASKSLEEIQAAIAELEAAG